MSTFSKRAQAEEVARALVESQETDVASGDMEITPARS